MRLAVFTDEVSQDLDKALALATRYRADGVELRSVWNTPVAQLTEEQVARIRTALDKANLQCAALASPVFKCELEDDAAIAEHLQYLRNCVAIAKKLDTKIIRIFTFWKHGPSAPVWEQIKAKFRPALPIAEEAGMILGLENEASTYVATAAEAKRFLEEMASPAIRLVWDPCNEVFAEEGITPFPDAYKLVAPWVLHVHVKDAKRDPRTNEPHVVCVGEGMVDWKGQLRTLLSKDYQGYASLETHWRPQALTEEQMNRPGGEAFSESGEYASDLCMQNLVQMIAEVRKQA
jgi:sugar phosphate isomerase/epimerase